MPDRDEIRGSIVLLIAAAAIAWCDVTAAASPDDAPPMVQRSPQVSISYAESSAPMIVTARSGSAFPSPFMPVTAVNFLGQGHTLSSGTQTGTPPDPNGAAGPDRYVQVVNGGIAIWDKTGAVVASSQFLNTLWSGYVGTNAGNACATSKDGDPIVLYDQLADRWFVSQFSIPNSGTNFNPSFQCVAVSKTGDPAGAYWLYDFPYAGLNDYGQFAVWPDAYYATFNLFNPSFAGPILCAYDRTSMLAGSPATQQCFQQSNSFNGVLPASLDGPIRPPRGEPAFFMNLGTNALKLWELHVDWTTPANSMLSGPTTLSVTPFTQPCSGSCVPQQSPGNLLISLSDRLMPRLTYRNFGTHESIVVNHTVTSGATSGIRWYEIRSPNGTPVVFQQGTFAPADGKWRWMGSIAQDQAQGFAAGYSLSATTMAPAIAWAGRMAGDAAGTFGQAESVVQSGSGVETGNNFNGTIASSWGYYSSMTVDPVDDCTFWYTAELYGTNGIKTWDTRVASVKFPNCAANDFSISIAPPAQTVLPGGQVAYTVSTGSIAGTPETIILNVQDLPAGVSASFAPSTVTAGSTSTLTLTATAAAPFVAPAPFTVIGKAPSAVHATSAQVGVTPAAPANLIATVNSAGSVDVSWTPAAGAATYELYRKVEGTSLSSYATGLMTNSFTDTSVTADTAYLYKVNAVNAGVSSLDSNIDLATTTIYNDEPLVAGSSVVQGDPLTKMRTAVNAVRALAGRLPASFTDVPPAGAPIRSMHVTELRSALDDARSHLFLSSLTYSNTAAPGTPIRTIDVTEIRDGMK